VCDIAAIRSRPCIGTRHRGPDNTFDKAVKKKTVSLLGPVSCCHPPLRFLNLISTIGQLTYRLFFGSSDGNELEPTSPKGLAI
jgi:hypothetical protein